ncbi:interleukin-5 receptor subunit alpha-like [Leptodactylus fuscus]|uniref:interleukin-5 receptor subunit alpha-like n=1 Tax=Leptodactylus fuscus TaxID=238119 RepID=UPI003F4EB43E
MDFQGNEYVWILLLDFILVCNQMYLTDGSIHFFLKQPNVTVSHVGRNSVLISWEAEEIAETENFSVCYLLSYQFSDKAKEPPRKFLLETTNHKIRLHMHPGLVGSVSNAFCESQKIQFHSIPAEFTYNAPPVYINNVSCVLFNITNLNCSWNFATDTPEDLDYSFALRLNSKWLSCRHYFKRHKKNTGCYMQDVFSDYNDDTPLKRIKIGFFSDFHSVTKIFSPEAVEILTPPRNIQVLLEDRNVIIKWFPPPSIVFDVLQDGMTSTYDPEEEGNFVYEIRVIENKSKKIFRQPNYIEKEEQIFTDLAKDKKYCLQIRARHNHSKFWGEWSEPVFINKDKNVFPEWILIVIGPALFAALVFYLCKRYMKIMLLTPIPHPSQNIKNWLYTNGSNDLRMQANIAGQNEQSVPLTELEIVTTTRHCDKKL